MKKVFLCSVLLLLITTTQAAIPQSINFQGNLTNASGDIVPDGNYNLTIRLYSGEFDAIGTHVWQDTFNTATKQGNFAIPLGSGATSLASLDFNNPYWVAIQVDSGTEMGTRLPLQTVPYAMQANAIADNTVTSEKIVDATITTDDIANSAVTATKVADNAIDTQAKAPWAPKINVDGSVRDNPKIICGTITTGVSGTGYAAVSYATFGFTDVPKFMCMASDSSAPILISKDDQRVSQLFMVHTIDAATDSAVNVDVDWIMIGY